MMEKIDYATEINRLRKEKMRLFWHIITRQERFKILPTRWATVLH